MKNPRGQAYIADMGVAVFIFMVIVLSILALWAETYRHVFGVGERGPLWRRAVDVSELLVKTNGDPVNWFEKGQVNTSNTYHIGLAKEENVLDKNRLDKLNTTNKTVINTIFGLAGDRFELTVTANWTDNPRLLYNISTFNGNESRVYSVDRIVLYNRDWALLRLQMGR
jgi:hypothetical protein